mmetsp:Transcript_16819/g.26235  ORF Transcript_16819/g.26235 Transcript_16819/m.26235 type:complete len:373 (-) Transcript_16819:237-1355(-)|eukprot:CAMPEP_0196808522 /NCGR_PEP_ID=MMETSP1362-20130617/8507_1 /TAXON_ID=163516 /ORGANISM="Leptocylindrus danicus, Strain CCMP1856" /LENGTH=372 /DNA_ID=CAMNT_0042182893 /DNA_START=90 /DNA_END=1208 /DNA_ORIENTATION=+
MSTDSARAAPQDHASHKSSGAAAVSSNSSIDHATHHHDHLGRNQKQKQEVSILNNTIQEGTRMIKGYPMVDVDAGMQKDGKISSSSSKGATAAKDDTKPTESSSSSNNHIKQTTDNRKISNKPDNGAKAASVSPPASQSSASSSPQMTANGGSNGESKPKPARGRKKRGRPPRSRSGDNADMESSNNGSAHHNNGKDGAQTSEEVASGPLVMPLTKKFVANGDNTTKKNSNTKEFRWRAHRAAEDYVTLVGNIMYPGTYMGPFGYSHEQGKYPVERPCMLGLLQSPLRHPTVIERWSPYEIASFEAAMTLYGKEFHAVQKVVKTKTTKEIVEFYYIWKKTSHYKRWKEQFEPEVESEDEEIMDLRPGKRSKS